MWDSQFVQNVTLLVVTAALTSLLIPYILKRVEDKRTLEQKQREADLARQAKIIDAQAVFLDDISIHLWNWRYLSMRLAYYGAQHPDVANPKYAEAEADYDKSIWDVFRLTRNEISRARRLLPSHMYQKLVALYEDEMVKLDNEIHQARSMDDISDRAEAFFTLNHRIYHHVTSNIDEVLNEIASELKLTQTLVTVEGGYQSRDSGERRNVT